MATASRRLRVLSLLLALGAASASAEDRYRVELLVFRHTDTDPPPAEVTTLRAFRDAWDLQDDAPPPHPVPSGEPGDTFDAAWRRLERVAGYEPLARLAWEQSRVDYQPPVRVHGEEIIAEALFFPYDAAFADLRADDPLGAYRVAWYRLDGSVRLRHSRFLHLDLDLEYRLDEPAWALPPPLPTLEQVTGALDQPGPTAAAGLAEPGAKAANDGPGSEEGEREFFRVHRLKQTRQVRTGDVHYFDTPYLGVLARVTALQSD